MSESTKSTTETNGKAKGKRPAPSPTPPGKHRKTTNTTASTSTSSPTLQPLSYKDLPTDWTPPTPPLSSTTSPTPTLTLTHHTGSLFTAPSHTLLVHACNTQGSWGAGIASSFKSLYPRAYTVYRTFCTVTHNPKTNAVPTGTALLIPPSPDDGDKVHWVGCLFTSAKYGRARDGKEVILRNTRMAVEMLLQLVRMVGEEGKIEGVRMCRINSGKFGVEWERTESVLEGIEVREGWVGNVEVWTMEE